MDVSERYALSKYCPDKNIRGPCIRNLNEYWEMMENFTFSNSIHCITAGGCSIYRGCWLTVLQVSDYGLEQPLRPDVGRVHCPPALELSHFIMLCPPPPKGTVQGQKNGRNPPHSTFLTTLYNVSPLVR